MTCTSCFHWCRLMQSKCFQLRVRHAQTLAFVSTSVISQARLHQTCSLWLCVCVCINPSSNIFIWLINIKKHSFQNLQTLCIYLYMCVCVCVYLCVFVQSVSSHQVFGALCHQKHQALHPSLHPVHRNSQLPCRQDSSLSVSTIRTL